MSSVLAENASPKKNIQLQINKYIAQLLIREIDLFSYNSMSLSIYVYVY